MFELFQQCDIFGLFLSYAGTVPREWYFWFISIIMIEINQKNTLLDQFQHMIEINQKYHSLGTVPAYDRNKPKISHCWNSSNI
jgi:hypothetical protein